MFLSITSTFKRRRRVWQRKKGSTYITEVKNFQKPCLYFSYPTGSLGFFLIAREGVETNTVLLPLDIAAPNKIGVLLIRKKIE